MQNIFSYATRIDNLTTFYDINMKDIREKKRKISLSKA